MYPLSSLYSACGSAHWLLSADSQVSKVIKVFLTFTSLNLVLLWQLFYLFCSNIVINTVIVTTGTLSRNESGRFGALKSDSTHHFFRNACTKSGSLRFSQFSGCWLILSVYILMSFDFPFVRLFGVRSFCYYPYSFTSISENGKLLIYSFYIKAGYYECTLFPVSYKFLLLICVGSRKSGLKISKA
jgi:hypothetical protein